MRKMTILPKIDILPEAQRELWTYLNETPSDFVLYGGTAVALRYGHRESVDFDFFSSVKDKAVWETTDVLSFVKKFAEDKEQISVESGSQAVYSLRMSNGAVVSLTFMRDEDFICGAVDCPQESVGNGVKIASALDLLAAKINAMLNRSKVKDFVDISVLIQNGLSLEYGFASAMAIRSKYLERDIYRYNFLCDLLTNKRFIKNTFDKDVEAPQDLKDKLYEVTEIITAAAEKLSIISVIRLQRGIITSKDLNRKG